MHKIRTALVAALCAALAVSASGRPQRRNAPRRQLSAVAGKATGGKGAMVLQVGSDWCVSGESVRKAFLSSEFKWKWGSKFVLAVYDEMESPTPAAKAANAEIGSLLIRTKRFPAITCYISDGEGLHVFAQIENVPQDVDGERLARAVSKVVAKKDQAVKLFSKAKSALNEEAAADMYGEAFDILASMMGPFHAKELTRGEWAWTKEWEALRELDKGDRFGWVRHFEMDDLKCVEMVASVTRARSSGSSGKSAAEIVADIKKIPQKHFSANQKQCVKVMEYALTYSGMDVPLTPDQRQLMEDAFAMGRDTFWGQFAMGRLMLDGKDIKSRGLPKAKVRPRPSATPDSPPPPFPLETVKASITSILPNAALTDEQKLAIARYAVLRLVGEEAWDEVARRPGAGRFLRAFVNDRAWLEDFAWSGSFPQDSRGSNSKSCNEPGAAAGAFKALEELVFQDGGRWTPFEGGRFADNEGRRFMTAFAINNPDRDEAYLADVLDAYRGTAKAGRLHKSAYSQPVWLWRYAIQQCQRVNYLDGNSAAQHRQLDKFLNQPTYNGGGDTTGLMRYHLDNCFNEHCNTGPYYKPWRVAGEWPMSRYVQIVGGVCAQISSYGSAVANAHGMPSSTVSEPGHLSYTRRLLDGRWCLNYTVTGHSMTRLAFWNRRPWQYMTVLERTFTGDRESRLATDRLLELAHVAEDRGAKSDTVEAYYRRACNLWPQHYRAWYEYGDWVARSKVPLDTMRTWLKGCSRGMKTGSRPLWDFLTPFFARVAQEKGAKGLADELVHFAPLLRQGDVKFQQEADFDVALEEWCGLLGGDEKLAYDVFKAMLSAQWGTRDCFAQTLGWGSKFFIPRSGTETLVKCISEAVPQGAMKKGGGVDLGPSILTASNGGNLDVFRTLVKLQSQIEPEKRTGTPYPKRDFSGSLLSCDGMVKMSDFANNENAKKLGRVIDDSPDYDGFVSRGSAPWVQVTLEGPSVVKGVVFSKGTSNVVSSQFPLFVDVSEDGEKWTRVRVVDSGSRTARVEFKTNAPRARHVRVGRVEGVKDDFFAVAKVLVYGSKLY